MRRSTKIYGRKSTKSRKNHSGGSSGASWTTSSGSATTRPAAGHTYPGMHTSLGTSRFGSSSNTYYNPQAQQAYQKKQRDKLDKDMENQQAKAKKGGKTHRRRRRSGRRKKSRRYG